MPIRSGGTDPPGGKGSAAITGFTSAIAAVRRSSSRALRLVHIAHGQPQAALWASSTILRHLRLRDMVLLHRRGGLLHDIERGVPSRPLPALSLTGFEMSLFLDRLTFFNRNAKPPAGTASRRPKTAGGKDGYRKRWQHDKIVRSTTA